MKKIIAILAASTIALCALTGCGNSAANAKPVSAAASSDGLGHGIQMPYSFFEYTGNAGYNK